MELIRIAQKSNAIAHDVSLVLEKLIASQQALLEAFVLHFGDGATQAEIAKTAMDSAMALGEAAKQFDMTLDRIAAQRESIEKSLDEVADALHA